ncbi:hypothetical protein AKJ09_05236 [Labilithrix luteola]|uniref:Uncharacterized protein n=1 Tax=Labilithrix luteola TaxID=1391654 RepID=A0A0K1PYJ3_9BACT|nr:hypothetical protein AKJ09_05236 [Labilithrix luteola]
MRIHDGLVRRPRRRRARLTAGVEGRRLDGHETRGKLLGSRTRRAHPHVGKLTRHVKPSDDQPTTRLRPLRLAS